MSVCKKSKFLNLFKSNSSFKMLYGNHVMWLAYVKLLDFYLLLKFRLYSIVLFVSYRINVFQITTRLKNIVYLYFLVKLLGCMGNIYVLPSCNQCCLIVLKIFSLNFKSEIVNLYVELLFVM